MTVRYAIIGAGMMGQEHIRNLALVPGASVTAIADPHDGMREEASALAGDQAQSFSSHGDLLSADMSDAFVVASPNHTHKGVLADLTAAGKPILVEKPLCTTQADCAEAAALAEAAGVPLWVAMEYRYMPAIARLIEDVEKGAAGTLHMISIREHRFPFLDKVGDWNRFQANTGGTMVEKCCHFFDLMRLILKSEPVRVYASGAQSVNHLNERYDGAAPDILDNAFVVVDFASGARGMLELSMFAEGSEFQESVAVIGDTAKIEALVPGPGRFRPADQSTDSLLIHSP
ncbi:MAG: Gfo/Idh/MocA family oxidoreductase, partial [Pseudomonadota bacterium]